MIGRLAFGCALTALSLGGCRARDNDPGPGGVTVGEARSLDDAAKMLESRPPTPQPAAPQTAPAKR